ncbi:MAG: DUF2203 domain-containing protein [Solirubrobacteraceae bacterium]
MTDESADFLPMHGMRHHHHYTLDQAMAVRAWVAERVGWVRDARARLLALGPGTSEAIDAMNPDAGGAYPGREIAHSLVEISRAVGELDAMEIVLRDPERGLVDFPAVQPDDSGAVHDCGGPGCPARGTPEGVEVYLCWLVDDEESIGFWHEPEAGFGGRRPL